jgi:hypothetical protein
MDDLQDKIKEKIGEDSELVSFRRVGEIWRATYDGKELRTCYSENTISYIMAATGEPLQQVMDQTSSGLAHSIKFDISVERWIKNGQVGPHPADSLPPPLF